MKANYSHSKQYASGGKWSKPVIVPEYKGEGTNVVLAWIIYITFGLMVCGAACAVMYFGMSL